MPEQTKGDLYAKLAEFGIDTTHIVGDVQAHGGTHGALLTWECQKHLNVEQVEQLLGIRLRGQPN